MNFIGLFSYHHIPTDSWRIETARLQVMLVSSFMQQLVSHLGCATLYLTHSWPLFIWSDHYLYINLRMDLDIIYHKSIMHRIIHANLRVILLVFLFTHFLSLY